MSEHKNIRSELTPSLRKKLLQNAKCFYCGSTKNLVIHHILPISMGGDNRKSNLLVACSVCHKAIHGTEAFKNLQKHGIKNTKQKIGRPRAKKPDNWDEVIARWHAGEITAIKAMELTGTTRSTFYKYINEW